MRVRADAAQGAFFGDYIVGSREGHSYRVEFRSSEQPINSCDCVDYEVNGLGTCKHIEAVRQHLRGKRMSTQRSVTEVYLDRCDQYGEGPRIRVLWADQLRTDDRVSEVVRPFFGASDVLLGEPADALPALDRAAQEAGLGLERVRLSEHITPWIKRLQRQRRRASGRRHLLADVAAGKQNLDVLRYPLYAYQQEGMLHLAFKGRAILADEMGLGKTVQAIAACELLRRLRGGGARAGDQPRVPKNRVGRADRPVHHFAGPGDHRTAQRAAASIPPGPPSSISPTMSRFATTARTYSAC
ncbi:DEAD/DEAH box helicase [Nitrococcus mobilis]|uniref:SWIM-type domain-containing protein n=1 Tax=Nitrococcus mobilis Nb-231 TaxID=314278 RepID=A4BN58_9GAMM|nr:hypothetical protein [Nitrococcus mobilis]EAR22657.1 hypothetical protein NB231_09403 [Nitrococcus mobilis Nb-231]